MYTSLQILATIHVQLFLLYETVVLLKGYYKNTVCMEHQISISGTWNLGQEVSEWVCTYMGACVDWWWI